jgi:hypothetical protein
MPVSPACAPVRAIKWPGRIVRRSTPMRGYTGLRWNGMAALRVQDFEMLRMRVSVHRGVTEVSGQLEWSTPKTYERRSVPFPRSIAQELVGLMEGKRREEHVFTSPEGGVLRLSMFRPRIFANAVKRLGKADPDFRASRRTICGIPQRCSRSAPVRTRRQSKRCWATSQQC